MKTTELRIGNLIQDNNGWICKVSSIDEIGIMAPAIVGAITTFPMRGIRITPKILLALGFKQRGEDRWYLPRFHGFELSSPRYGGSFSAVKFTADNAYYVINPNVIFLHRLQNLVFEMWDRELPIDMGKL